MFIISTLETSDSLKSLGVDDEDFYWQKLALCNDDEQQIEVSLFFEQYEESESVARMVDEMCLSCPVMAICLKEGHDNAEWGVWGGIYMVRGKSNAARNAHKTKKTWDRIKERLIEDAVF